MAAYSLTRYRIWPGKLATFILLGYMFPPIVLIIPFFVWFKAIGLTDSYVGLTVTYVALGLPFATWLLWAFFQSIPLELEAAWIDGATRARAILHVVLPLAAGRDRDVDLHVHRGLERVPVRADLDEHRPDEDAARSDWPTCLSRPMTDWGVIMAAGVVITLPGAGLLHLHPELPGKGRRRQRREGVRARASA